MQGFLQSDSFGIAMGGMASYDMTTLEKDEACTYGDAWYSLDHTYHWRECECGNRGNLGEHTMKWVEVEPATQEKSGIKQNVCATCGYKGRTDELKYGEKLNDSNGNNNLLLWILGAASVIAIGGAGVFVILKKKK